MDNIKNVLESLLFVARKPLDPKVVAEELQSTKEVVTSALEELVQVYEGKGINIVKVAGGYLMGTNSANADYIHAHLHAKMETRLSPQALETLSIIAYKQPVTSAEIERIRGVNSDGPLDSLVQKKLIADLGRSDSVGRPYLYGTTTEFLRHFGLKNLKDLPPLPVSERAQEDLFKIALHEEVSVESPGHLTG
ncbi:MAG: SMC-Scp complex subunit ScpB [bacterium]